jgi:hypothetical protein
MSTRAKAKSSPRLAARAAAQRVSKSVDIEDSDMAMSSAEEEAGSDAESEEVEDGDDEEVEEEEEEAEKAPVLSPSRGRKQARQIVQESEEEEEEESEEENAEEGSASEGDDEEGDVDVEGSEKDEVDEQDRVRVLQAYQRVRLLMHDGTRRRLEMMTIMRRRQCLWKSPHAIPYAIVVNNSLGPIPILGGNGGWTPCAPTLSQSQYQPRPQYLQSVGEDAVEGAVEGEVEEAPPLQRALLQWHPHHVRR